jgi:Protein of unknown function (DUF1592)/Protein of unknown function (DUF1588)/Protein of unknown function (DUF1587)/Protein of unknown function (DUF1595)/Protein of unknown function (DUF1585)/Planctomycete cytochrome C
MTRRMLNDAALCLFLSVLVRPAPASAGQPDFFEKNCHRCHNAKVKKGGFDLAGLESEASNPDSFARWVKVHDRIDSGEMPPKKEARPPADETTAAKKWVAEVLVKAEAARRGKDGRTGLRRMTRTEYENTLRDLFDLPGIALRDDLPADGTAYGFDNNSEALDISHVNLAKYLEAADHVLDMAIATRPGAPTVLKQRVSLANPHGFVAHVLMHGDAVLLKDKKPDPDFPPAGAQMHLDQGAHERMGSFRDGASVGLFRHEDESFHPSFIEFVALYPGNYRVRTSLWSFQWDKGKVLPARGTEAARLSVIHLTGDGRGGDHPSTVLGYFDAPSLREQVHEFVSWLNYKDTLGFNAASLALGAQTRGKDRAMGFTGPGIACDYLEVEGPLHDVWPPRSHRLLFGNLPLVEFKPSGNPGSRAPKRQPVRVEVGAGKNRPDPEPGIWTVASEHPSQDADRLLAQFLPRAFRRPVSTETRKAYLAKFEERLKAGDCFETAMRWVYRAALCSPDFLYHVEPAGELDDYALACRLSYLLWKSLPDKKLTKLAQAGRLRDDGVLEAEAERLLNDPKSQRFVEDFLGQWLKLRQIASTDPDRKLYPEFSPYLQDSMVAETQAYFRELLVKDLDVSHFVKSDFAMLNEKLAVLYGVKSVSGSQVRRVKLTDGSVRGPFLTQASVLKVTANGTTTSPVPRGAFVLDRLLGRPPEPPPPNIPAIEPDVRGARTIREQLDKHRADASCAVCHARIDPPGFALESFDVIGGFRERYRSIGAGDPAPRGSIDPFIGISFKLGPKVDAGGVLPDGRTFAGIGELENLLAADTRPMLTNLARQFLVYGTGREVSFGDRVEIAAILAAAQKKGGGVRTLLHGVIRSGPFRTR